jgi:hypothetical protein
VRPSSSASSSRSREKTLKIAAKQDEEKRRNEFTSSLEKTI